MFAKYSARYLAPVALIALSSVTATAPAAPQPRPGTVVSVRPLGADELIPQAAKGFRIIYRTAGQNGEPQVSGGSVYLPAGTPPAGGRALVSWAHGTSGMTAGCAPNLTGGMADTFNETPQLSTYLARGYAVAATDYIGLGGPGTYEYLASRAAGHAVLDIVRAARRLDPGLAKSFAIAGHSIGGQAALAAARMHPGYAPDLDLRGTLAYAPTSNVEDLIGTLGRPGVPAVPALNGLHARLVMILAGLDHARPDVRVTDFLSPHGKEAIAIARRGRDCVKSLESAVAGKPIGLLFSAPLSDPQLMAALRDYLAVPTTGHRRPLLLLQGAADTVQPIPTTVLLQQQLRHSGADSHLATHASASHFTILNSAAPEAQAFLARVLTVR
ncbi:MAG: hypothetical protein HOQ24_08440 [Mycobacteriaceae bacterium]|nr:hypothetical protein [Mycobacteriaceae bacterium]